MHDILVGRPGDPFHGEESDKESGNIDQQGGVHDAKVVNRHGALKALR